MRHDPDTFADRFTVMNPPLLLSPGITQLLAQTDPARVCVIPPAKADAIRLSQLAGYPVEHLTAFPTEVAEHLVVFASLTMDGFFRYLCLSQTYPVVVIAIINGLPEEFAKAKLIGVPHMLRQPLSMSR